MSAQFEEVTDRAPSQAVEAGSLLAINRAEIDGQIATARAFPRSISKFMKEARELVAIDEETAESCIYSLKRGKERDPGTGRMVDKYLTGPSARFAEILLYSFGNCRAGGRVIEEGKDCVIAQGVFHDLEKNVQITKENRRGILTSEGQRYKRDMITVTGNAAISIALRNAILAGIPQAIWLPIYEVCKEVAVGDVTTLSTRRANAVAWFGKVGISPERLMEHLGVEGIEDVGIEQLETLVGIKTSIRRGDVTPEQAFASPVESTLKAATSANAVGDMAAVLEARRKQQAASEPNEPSDAA